MEFVTELDALEAENGKLKKESGAKKELSREFEESSQ